MVLSLYQSNVYIKRNLRIWRAQKRIPLLGAKPSLTYVGLQTTLSQVSQYRAENGNLRKSGSTFCHGTVFAPKQLYNIKKVRIWRVQKCIPLVGAKTSLTCAGLQTTPSHVSQYRTENGNFRKSGSTFCHGTMFAPKQCLFQKEATGMESPKMYSSRQCKTSLTSAGLQTIPSHVRQFRAENGNLQNPGLLLAMVPSLHQSNVYIKRMLHVWTAQKCIPLVSAKASVTCAGLQTLK